MQKSDWGIAMQKRILALAVAAALTAPLALAESNVQLYGKMNLALERVEARDSVYRNLPAQGRVTDGLSYLGFRGKESLTDSLQVFWQVETAVKPDDGCGYLGCGGDANQPLLGVAAGGATLGNRNSFVGLRGDLGQIQFGRMDMYYEKHVPNELHLLKTGAASTALAILSNQANTGAAGADPLRVAGIAQLKGGNASLVAAVQQAAGNGAVYTGIKAAAVPAVSSTDLAQAGKDTAAIGAAMYVSAAGTFYNVGNRYSNVVQYRSPTWNGLTAIVAYRAGENKGDEGKLAKLGGVSRTLNSWNGEASLQFQARQYYASYTHITEHDPEAMGGLLDEATGDKLALGFHPTTDARLGVVYERVRNLFVPGLPGVAGDSWRDTWAALASQKLGPVEVYATYGRALDATIAGNEDEESGARYLQLTGTYALSKTTNLYLGVAEVKNDSNAAYNFFIEGAATASASTQSPVGSTARGARIRSVQMGVNHFF